MKRKVKYRHISKLQTFDLLEDLEGPIVVGNFSDKILTLLSSI